MTNKLLFQGQVTSEQQFQFIPRQPSEPQQPQQNRFTQPQPQPPTRFTPSARPATGSDGVPTVPAVTSFQRFQPSEATDIENNFRFNPSPRPQQFQPQPAAQPPVFQEEPRRLPLNPGQQFQNSHTSVRTPTFTIPPAIKIEPIAGSGVIQRQPLPSLEPARQPLQNLDTSESETTGTAFRGRQRLRVRPEQVERLRPDPETLTRNRNRAKIRFTDAEDTESEETETVPPTTAGRVRTRSRFPLNRSRAATAPRAPLTGARKRQRFRGVADDDTTENIDNTLQEEDRRSDIGSSRRKVNRIPNFTSRRKTTQSPEAPTVTRIPPRRRLKPFQPQEEQETERPAVEEFEPEGGISVQTVSTVRSCITFIINKLFQH